MRHPHHNSESTHSSVGKRGHIQGDKNVSDQITNTTEVKKRVADFISNKRVEWLIVDEADKLFEDGKKGFREQVRKLDCQRMT
jgi:hypothetical protein